MIPRDMDRVGAALRAFDEEIARLRREFDLEPPDPNNSDWIKRKLTHMAAVDQSMRRRIDEDGEYSEEESRIFQKEFGLRWDEIDSRNTRELKELLNGRDWFKISEFGADADQAAWLLVQHADRDVEFQKRILAVLEKLVQSGETSGSNYAYLYDRVAIAENRLQRFGTQGRCVAPGCWEPWPSEDPSGLQQRRDALGLGSLEENIRRVSKMCR